MLDENGLPVKKKPGLALLAAALWVFTSALSFLEILAVRAIVLRIYGHFVITDEFYLREFQGAQVLSMGTVVVMGILCLGVAIGCGEYHFKHFGDPKSWRLFGWTISAEVAILVLALFV